MLSCLWNVTALPRRGLSDTRPSPQAPDPPAIMPALCKGSHPWSSTLAPHCLARSTQISTPASAHLSTLSLVAFLALACPCPPVSSQYPKQRTSQDISIPLCPGPLAAKSRHLCSQPPMTHLLLPTPRLYSDKCPV